MTEAEIKQAVSNLWAAIKADDEQQATSHALLLLQEFLVSMNMIAESLHEIAKNTVP